MLLQKPRFHSFSWLNSILLYICVFVLHIYIYEIYFLYIFIPWCILELFPYKIAAMNMGMHISCWVNVFICFRYIPRIGIAKSFGSSIFNCLRNFNAFFYSGCTNLCSQQYTMRPFSQHPQQHFLFLVFLMTAVLIHMR